MPRPGRRAASCLRLWPSGAALGASKADETPLWLGAVVTQKLSRVASFLTLARAEPDVNAARRQLAAALPTAKTVERADEVSPGRWDGRLLLAGPSAPTGG